MNKRFIQCTGFAGLAIIFLTAQLSQQSTKPTYLPPQTDQSQSSAATLATGKLTAASHSHTESVSSDAQALAASIRKKTGIASPETQAQATSPGTKARAISSGIQTQTALPQTRVRALPSGSRALALLPGTSALATQSARSAFAKKQPHVTGRHKNRPLAKWLNNRRSKQASENPRANVQSFARHSIAGFLQPDGFHRTHWQSFRQSSLNAYGANLLPSENSGRTKPRFVVIIDPGHGGSDPGSQAHNGLMEKHLTLDIARRARFFLSDVDDIDVVLTREQDRGLSRQDRVRRIRQSGADMIVSLHFNHLPQNDVTLVESFYASRDNIIQSRKSQSRVLDSLLMKSQLTSPRYASGTNEADLDFTRKSKRLASTLQQRVYSEVSANNQQAINAGIKQDTLYVLTRSYKPGALIEMTCLSNVSEAQKLLSEDYKNRLAAALADGIHEYLQSLEVQPTVRKPDLAQSDKPKGSDLGA